MYDIIKKYNQVFLVKEFEVSSEEKKELIEYEMEKTIDQIAKHRLISSTIFDMMLAIKEADNKVVMKSLDYVKLEESVI